MSVLAITRIHLMLSDYPCAVFHPSRFTNRSLPCLLSHPLLFQPLIHFIMAFSCPLPFSVTFPLSWRASSISCQTDMTTCASVVFLRHENIRLLVSLAYFHTDLRLSFNAVFRAYTTTAIQSIFQTWPPATWPPFSTTSCRALSVLPLVSIPSTALLPPFSTFHFGLCWDRDFPESAMTALIMIVVAIMAAVQLHFIFFPKS